MRETGIPTPLFNAEVELLSLEASGEEVGIGPYSIDRQEVVTVNAKIKNPWMQALQDAGADAPPARARLRYFLNGVDSFSQDVVINSPESTIALNMPAISSSENVNLSVSLEVYTPEEDGEQELFHGSLSFNLHYEKCLDGQAFSRELRRCGSTTKPSLRCEPVIKFSDYNYEGCHLWSYDINWGSYNCDPNVVYNCNDPFAPTTAYGCPDNPDLISVSPPPESVSITLDILYHDYSAEIDSTYTSNCNFNFN